MAVDVVLDEAGFGRLLQSLRRLRRKSQMELALSAGLSARHLGFLELSRARPSREMVLALSGALDLPFRERNSLLLAAGFAPVYRESSLTAPEMAQVKKALDFILEKQEPYPAVVLDRYWNLLYSNRGAKALFSEMIDISNAPVLPNLLRLMFDPSGIRPFVRNWHSVARNLLERFVREAVSGVLDARSLELLEELLRYPGVDPNWRLLDDTRVSLPFVPVEFAVGDHSFSYFSAVSTLGGPHEITAQELRIECFFPANTETEAAAAALWAASGHDPISESGQAR